MSVLLLGFVLVSFALKPSVSGSIRRTDFRIERERELLPASGCLQVKRHLVLSQKCRENLSISKREREKKRTFVPVSVCLASLLKCCSLSFQDTFDSQSRCKTQALMVELFSSGPES